MLVLRAMGAAEACQSSQQRNMSAVPLPKWAADCEAAGKGSKHGRRLVRKYKRREQGEA